MRANPSGTPKVRFNANVECMETKTISPLNEGASKPRQRLLHSGTLSGIFSSPSSAVPYTFDHFSASGPESAGSSSADLNLVGQMKQTFRSHFPSITFNDRLMSSSDSNSVLTVADAGLGTFNLKWAENDPHQFLFCALASNIYYNGEVVCLPNISKDRNFEFTGRLVNQRFEDIEKKAATLLKNSLETIASKTNNPRTKASLTANIHLLQDPLSKGQPLNKETIIDITKRYMSLRNSINAENSTHSSPTQVPGRSDAVHFPASSPESASSSSAVSYTSDHFSARRPNLAISSSVDLPLVDQMKQKFRNHFPDIRFDDESNYSSAQFSVTLKESDNFGPSFLTFTWDDKDPKKFLYRAIGSLCSSNDEITVLFRGNSYTFNAQRDCDLLFEDIEKKAALLLKESFHWRAQHESNPKKKVFYQVQCNLLDSKLESGTQLDKQTIIVFTERYFNILNNKINALKG